MTRNVRKGGLIAIVAIPIILGGAVASAQDKAACLDAAAKGQQLRDSHSLIEARDQFRICVSAACPIAIQSDCAGWLERAEKAVPTVVVTAKASSGANLVDVRVTMDGQSFATRLDGQAVAINSGRHAFHFETADGEKLDRQVTVLEGEQSQRIDVVLEAPAAPMPPSGPAPPPPSLKAPSHSLGTQRLIALGAGGVGVVGLALGTAFGAIALSQRNDAKNACPGMTCSTPGGSQKWNVAASSGNVSTVALIVGALGLGGGAILWISAPTATGPQLGIGPSEVQVRAAW
jgi:hypothetical protein